MTKYIVKLITKNEANIIVEAMAIKKLFIKQKISITN
jgi:hypothetical protein